MKNINEGKIIQKAILNETFPTKEGEFDSVPFVNDIDSEMPDEYIDSMDNNLDDDSNDDQYGTFVDLGDDDDDFDYEISDTPIDDTNKKEFYTM